MSNIDLGDSPTGSIPSEGQQNQIRTAIGINDTWRANLPIAVGIGPPQDLVLYNYESELTAFFTDGAPDVVLNYAGQYADHNSYTIGGTAIEGDPDTTPNYTALYRVLSGNPEVPDVWRFRVHRNSINYTYQYIAGSLETAFVEAAMWVNVATSASGGINQFIPANTTGLQSDINGQMYQSTGVTYSNYYFSSIAEGYTYWKEVVAKNGDAGAPLINLSNAVGNTLPSSSLSTAVPITRGGTGATTQQTASAALNPPIIDNAGIAITLSNVTHNGAVLRCTSASNVTITVNVDLGIGFSCDIIRAGTGTVAIAGASGQIIQAFTGLRISAQYGRATLTRVAANTYNLSGNTSL